MYRIKGLLPAMVRASRTDIMRVALGVALGLAVVTLLVEWEETLAAARGAKAWTLFAPLGATALLVFGVHTGPLSQPWSCVVGNTVSALWALLLVGMFSSTVTGMWLPALAVAGALVWMQLLRALHPPGGAIAMLLALEAQEGVIHPWHYAFVPIGVLTLVMVLLAMLYHKAWGKTYPVQGANPNTANAQGNAGVGSLSQKDLQALLARFDQGYNMTPQDLGKLVQAAEEEAIARKFGNMRCEQVMTAAPWTCQPQDSAATLAQLFHEHPIKNLPVVDAAGRLQGVVGRSDLFDWLWQHSKEPVEAKPAGWQVWKRWRKPEIAKKDFPSASDLMMPAPLCVEATTPVSELLQVLSQHTVPFVAVLRDGKLVGLITRTDIMKVLLG